MLNICKNSDDIGIVLEKEFGSDIYINWLSKLSLIKINNGKIYFSVPTFFIKDYIVREYYGTVNKRGLKHVLKENFNVSEIDIEVIKTDIKHENNVESISKNDNLYNIGTNLRRDCIFENFAVNKTNELAFNIAQSIVDSNEFLSPLFIYGNVGVGKTHLLQSIAWSMKDKYPDKNITYLSAEKFMYLYTSAVSARNMDDINKFKERFRNIDVLIIDDIQFIIGKEKTEKEFFYTFNILLGENKTIVIACDRYPDKMDVDELFKSRLKSGVVIDVSEPDSELKFSIAKKKADLFGLKCDEDVFDYISKNQSVVNGRDIESVIKKLVVEQNFLKKSITVESVSGMLFGIKKNVDTQYIQQKVSEYYKITKEELLSSKRGPRFVVPRQISYFLSKKITGMSYTDIARNFGRGHSIALASCEKIRLEINKKNYDIINSIKEIEKML
ncbi:MAG: chromosomal replication initiator protein DnaA [Rickettsiales bacterium]|jgi:chromosomal replication initiator protein|nr:chromosomal replication initiator protein DnaA [Rickettsiales bacterium]